MGDPDQKRPGLSEMGMSQVRREVQHGPQDVAGQATEGGAVSRERETLMIIRKALFNGKHNNPWPPGIELSRELVCGQDKDGNPVRYTVVVEC
jgi:hypothetical protein